MAIDRVLNSDARDLLMGFESLGEDCEFGLVQRHFRAESLGLLRWSWTRPDLLRTLLDNRFEGFADPRSLVLHRTPWGEYVVKNDRLGMQTHTWTNDCGPDEAAFLARQAARMAWLTDKMLENLHAADRIYVYKLRNHGFDSRMQQVAAALSAYGANRFLCVDVADDDRRPGQVDIIAPGFARGAIGRQGRAPGAGWNIAFDDWLAVCRAAADAFGR